MENIPESTKDLLRSPTNEQHNMIFMLVDIDHFKQVNDKFGHAAGDELLVQFSNLLKEVFRASDYLIRWGGEEFLLVLKDTNRNEAKELAERLRQKVDQTEFELDPATKIHKTCSIGFAGFPFILDEPAKIAWNEVVELADKCLYKAKNSGRNQWFGIAADGLAYQESLNSRIHNDDLDDMVKNERGMFVLSCSG